MFKRVIDFLRHKYFRFGLAATIYILWVIWLGNFWWLFGLVVVFDIYITKKVNWSFWKSRKKKNSVWIEWLDALIFAVIAVTVINIFLLQNYKIPTPSMEKSLLIGDHLYVSKVAYGPRLPNTPLSFPFTQNRMPLFGGESYLKWIQRPYKRLAGFGEVKRFDVVVFNFPAGDTVAVEQSARSYYSIIREYAEQLRQMDINNNRPQKDWQDYLSIGRSRVWEDFNIVIRPVDKRDNYIKRCVAIPGDTLLIRDGQIIINGEPIEEFEGTQHRHRVITTAPINPKAFERLGIAKSDQVQMGTLYELPLTEAQKTQLSRFSNVTDVQKYVSPPDVHNYQIFPHDSSYKWTLDQFGPLWMPAKGSTIRVTPESIIPYRRIIEAYEGNSLRVEGDQVWINGEPATEYTFQMNYYFMIGDNRHASSDCRYWGYVPEDHIMGKPKFIWLSLDQDKRFLGKIRWNRFFLNTDKI